jgi:hypothetical protein
MIQKELEDAEAERGASWLIWIGSRCGVKQKRVPIHSLNPYVDKLLDPFNQNYENIDGELDDFDKLIVNIRNKNKTQKGGLPYQSYPSYPQYSLQQNLSSPQSYTTNQLTKNFSQEV